jgi:RNA polymerase sigma factor (sigma-70 family)
MKHYTEDTEDTRANRFAVNCPPHILDLFDRKRAAWYESPRAVARGVERGREKAERLAWVRTQMVLRLTPREQQCITLYYFRGLTYEQAGMATGTHASSVLRGAQRGIRKLRAAREREGGDAL